MNKFTYPQEMYSFQNASNQLISFKKGKGCLLYDMDDNEYIDLWNGFGSILLGYSDVDLINGVNCLIRDNAISLNAPTSTLLELKRLLLEDFPDKENTAFFTTGTAGVRAAALIARKYTKKNLIISSGYHGWDPLWERSSVIFQPNDFGVINFYYILNILKEKIIEFKNDIAAIIISPDLSYFDYRYYQELFNLCRDNHLLIIIDDVKCGYRYHLGSSMSKFNLQGDLYIVSKGIANGAKISAVIGNGDLLIHAKDFCYTSYYNLYPIQSSIITLNKMKRLRIQETIRKQGNLLIEGLNVLIKKYELPIMISGNGNLFQFIFARDKLSNQFYDLCIEFRLLLYKNDNQCLSYAFNDEMRVLALERFEKVFSKMKEIHIAKQSMVITNWNICKTAYHQIDGCADMLDLNEKIMLIKEMEYGDEWNSWT